MENETVMTVEQTEEPVPESPRYNKAGKRRGRVRYAAPLGFLTLLFALIGVIAVIVWGIRGIVSLADDTAVTEELYHFLDPVTAFCPPAFEDAGEGDQDTLLLSAVYRVTEAERIRQLREKDNHCTYELDESQLRMFLPTKTVEGSFAALFGEAKLNHHTAGDVEYDQKKGGYYVPLSLNTSGYRAVIDTVKKSDDTYTVRVCYIAESDVQVDEWGKEIPPTADMSKYAQNCTVRRNEDDSLTLVSIEAE